MQEFIYLDNNATTQVAPEVYECMLPYYREMFASASSIHSFGEKVGKQVALAREQTAELFHAYPDEIIFTSCGTESDNTAVRSAIETQPDKKHLVMTQVEHAALLSMGAFLEKKGYEITYLSVNRQGQLDLEELKAAIRPDTALVSIMFANNETGTVFPMEKIADIVKSKGTLFHVDAVSTVGKEVIDLQKLPIDFLALSGHKVHAPKGIGVLYVRRGTDFQPLLLGSHQENGRRAGTLNSPTIIGLGKACELANTNIEAKRQHMAKLRDMLEQGILAQIPDALVNGDREHRLPNTANIAFKGLQGKDILLALDKNGICVSAGTACSSGKTKPSHVISAMGIDNEYAHGAVRFSLSRYTTEEEIQKAVQIIPKAIKQLEQK